MLWESQQTGVASGQYLSGLAIHNVPCKVLSDILEVRRRWRGVVFPMLDDIRVYGIRRLGNTAIHVLKIENSLKYNPRLLIACR